MKHNVVVENRVILFTDIHEFSLVFNELERKGYSFLQEVFEELGDLVVRYEGEILKYLGDGMLCIFPADSESDTIKCALEMRRAYANIVRTRNISHATELEIGIGAGEVEMGMFGHESLVQKEVFGEEVNLTAMIGHHRGIAITERVYDKVKANYETNRLPDFEAKWRDEPLRVWEVVKVGSGG